MPLYLKRLTETARLPTRATEYAAGLDLYADETITIPEYNRAWVSTGIAIALNPYHVGQIWPRSGLAGHGLDTSAGVVDADYRGPVKVLLVNGSHERKTVHAGDRIAQLLVMPITRPDLIEVDELPATERGANGFGSTGR
jgi:dUTP pyrophosphatase